jgi:hypothetical protein
MRQLWPIFTSHMHFALRLRKDFLDQGFISLQIQVVHLTEGQARMSELIESLLQVKPTLMIGSLKASAGLHRASTSGARVALRT